MSKSRRERFYNRGARLEQKKKLRLTEAPFDCPRYTYYSVNQSHDFSWIVMRHTDSNIGWISSQRGHMQLSMS